MEREKQTTKKLSNEQLAKKLTELVRTGTGFGRFGAYYHLSMNYLSKPSDYTIAGIKISNILDHEDTIDETRRFFLGGQTDLLDKTLKQLDEEHEQALLLSNDFELTLPTTLDKVRYGLLIRSMIMGTGILVSERLMLGEMTVDK